MARLMSASLLVALCAAQEPAPSTLQGARALSWSPVRGLVAVECADGSLRTFDVFLRPQTASPSEAAWEAVRVGSAGDAGADLAVWGGRVLHLDAADGSLTLGAAPWERPPSLRWGPGWLCVEFRSAQPGGVLEWRRAGSEATQALRFQVDRADGLTQRVWLEGLRAGDTLELLWQVPQLRFPAAEPPVWRSVEVPAVDPAGARPTAAWPGD